jgi:uncharacterized membrane protein YdjX (TVP38/TMEM64 family)
MRTQKNKKIIIIVLTSVGMAAFFFLTWWSYPYLPSDKLRAFIEDAGALGPLALMAYVVLAHVIAPLGGLPAFIVGVAVFGLFQTIVYIYVASMVSAVINYYISRTFGRPLVRLLVGVKGIEKVDEWTSVLGRKILLAGRVFGLFLFEEISYAAGLTAINFRDYMTITALGTAVPSALLLISFRNANFNSAEFFTLSIIAVAIVGVVSAGSLVWFLKFRKNKKK